VTLYNFEDSEEGLNKAEQNRQEDKHTSHLLSCNWWNYKEIYPNDTASFCPTCTYSKSTRKPRKYKTTKTRSKSLHSQGDVRANWRIL